MATDDDPELAEILKKSREEHEKTETLRRKEEEEFQQAINASLAVTTSNLEEQQPQNSEMNPTAGDGEPSSSTLPESSGLVRNISNFI